MAAISLAEPSASAGAPAFSAASAEQTAFAQKVAETFTQLPPPVHHFEGLTERAVRDRLRQDDAYRQVLREKLQDRWFAALVPHDPPGDGLLTARFETWQGLIEFIQERNALVEVWAYGEGGPGNARRIPAPEVTEIKRQPREPPVFATVTYPEPESGRLRCDRIEFGFQAAQVALAAHQGYQRQRQLQLAVHTVLGARDASGRPSALAQWNALQDALEQSRIQIDEMPPKPANPTDLFVAAEYEVDDSNSLRRVVRFHRESEVQKHVLQNSDGRSVQVLRLQKAGERRPREALGYAIRGATDELIPMPNPILGRDFVELRVKDSNLPDVRRWNVLEFGEPELLKQSALARFALLNAHLDRQRKIIALRKSGYDLIAEPVIAALSLGGGLAGVGFPIGDAGRLAYNLISSRLIADVPTVKEMRGLFAALAAREKDPRLSAKPADFLAAEDIQKLTEAGRRLSDAEVQEYLERISDDDLRAMLKLGRLGMFDARLTNFLNILTSAGKVSGVTESGLLRDIFNSVYFSLNGDLNLKTLLAVALGQRVLTPLSGTSLEALSRGEGPAKAWAQFLEVSIDVRAVVNTVARLSKGTLAKKELEKPFPYGTRATDLAAYEIRVFGFPLLLFYKRGLIKDDLHAYENDYAYGMIGARLVEHFPTKEEMDAEIRAGRMAPLGYVRVWNGKDGWKETNLAVFAHRIPGGKHRGRTAIIIYGLKAYGEHSQYIDRELTRFRQFEQALEQGAVLEQVVEAGTPAQLLSRDFEPVIHVGEKANEEIFAPLLSGLLEVRRYWLRKSWGVAMPKEELLPVAAILERFAAQNVWLPDGDPLVGVDKFNGAFLYRRMANGQAQVVKLTRIPSLAEIDRAVAKSQEAARLEQIRREAMSEQGAGVVLLNRVQEVDGRFELGPLIDDPPGQSLGRSVTSGAQAVDQMLRRIDQLPVTDRARLSFNRFAGTVVDWDVNGRGVKERLFLTIEFPFGAVVRREHLNPLTGEKEMSVFEQGLCRQIVTPARLVELEYDDGQREQRSRTYRNQGTLAQPVKGPLLEETRTLDIWFRDLNQPNLDPYLPMIAKLRVNYITGAMSRETYGLFPSPVSVADDQFVTENRFNRYGLLESARVYENGVSEAEFERVPLAQLLEPVRGRERFHLTSISPDLTDRSDLGAQDFLNPMERTDLVKGLSKTVIFDNAHAGRILSESYRDSVDGSRTFTVTATRDYRADFFHGLVPVKTSVRAGANGRLVSEIATLSYDPLTRRLVGVESSYTGKVTTNTWDYRWENPIETETALRRTTTQFNRDETTGSGSTVAKPNGEELQRFSSQFDSAHKTWRMDRTFWFRPGITNQTETGTFSSFGRVLSVRSGNQLEARPVYDSDGMATGHRVWLRDPNTGSFEILLRQEDEYRWQNGGREARVQTFVEGQPYDQFRSVADPEGRVIIDGIRQRPGFSSQTIVTYDGASDRVARTEEINNDVIRVTREFLPAERQPDGACHLPVRITPHWGLISTQTMVLGEPLGRPLETVFESGDRVQVREWFAGSAIAKIAETRDRHGRIRERLVRRLHAGSDHDRPFDLTARYRVSHWGTPGLAETEASIPGTDVVLFKENSHGVLPPTETTTPSPATPEKVSGVDRPRQSADRRTYFDLSKPYLSPAYTVDPSGEQGVTVTIDRARQRQVTALHRVRVTGPRQTDPNQAAEPMMEVETIDLRGLFFHKVTRQTLDRAGKILAETVSQVSSLGEPAFSDQGLWEKLSQARLTKLFRYRYDRGRLIEKPDPATAGRRLVFTTNQAEAGAVALPVNDGRWREWVTQIEGNQAASADEPDRIEQESFSQRIHSPTELERNPYLPDRPGFWTSWLTTELRSDGRKLFDTETIYDGQGQVAVARTSKRTSSGEPGTKILYQIPPLAPEMLKRLTLTPGEQTVTIETPGSPDVSESDFLYLYLINKSNALWSVLLTDRAGRRVKVSREDVSPGRGVAPTWPIRGVHWRWLPDTVVPRHAALIDAPTSLLQDRSVLAVSVHDLALAGLDIRQVASCALRVQSPGESPLEVSPLGRMERGGPFLEDAERRPLSYAEQRHGTGLTAWSAADRRQTDRELFSGRRTRSVLEFNGLPMAMTVDRGRDSAFPPLVVLDASDTESPRPLYALSYQAGDFVEHYKTRRLGDVQIYTIAQGFDLPRFEVFNPSLLEDELSPGFIAYGYDYHVTIQYAKGGGWFTRSLARLHNRIVANVFKNGSDRLLNLFSDADARSEWLRRYHYGLLHNARLQANDIQDLPMLAQALLPTREVPWKDWVPGGSTNLNFERTRVALELLRLHVTTNLPATYLIPTAPRTAAERFVDTVKEADLIRLALVYGEVAIARELLEFYWQKSHGGETLLHSSYDARAGTAMALDFMFERPHPAKPTAEAQLAMADAAFSVGLKLGDRRWLLMGRNLLSNALTHFRPPLSTNAVPRGIAQSPVRPVHSTAFGLTLWPAANRYSLASNARAYLLLKQLENVPQLFSSDPAWRAHLRQAREEEEAWLKTYVLPQVEQTGVVPKGVFQIQDINAETTALGLERWTSAEDWLAFLEAAQPMGVPLANLRRWLENLARVHGVEIGGHWGLDWSIPLLRPDAISPELTARFMRVAGLIGHESAEKFSRQAVRAFRLDQSFPTVVTDAQRTLPLLSGQGFSAFPTLNRQAWPSSLGVAAQLASLSWATSTGSVATTYSTQEIEPAPRTDLTVFILLTAAFYLAILGASTFWWRFRALRKHDTALPAVPTQLVPDAVMQRAEERWSKRVLGVQTPPHAERTRFSNATLEQNFLMQLRAIYKLVLEWRRHENGWEEDDPRLVADESDDWLNGLDEFASLVGLYMRFVIKAGVKDGFSQKDVLTENEDSNHIWSRLLMYFAEYYWGLLTLMTTYANLVTASDRAALYGEISQLLKAMGMRQRTSGFDARTLFNFPANPLALDLLIVQKPGASLSKVLLEASLKLKIPYTHLVGFVEKYKAFKKREHPYPIHPYLIELGKVLPHFVLMGLGALVWFNQSMGDSPIVPYVWALLSQLALEPANLTWSLPLLGSLGLSVLAYFARIYRFEGSMLVRERPPLILDATVTSLFVKKHSALPQVKPGARWDADLYERGGWALRAAGFLGLGLRLLWEPTPSFATFLVVKGLFAMLAFAEVAGIVGPLAATALSKFLQDRVTLKPAPWRLTRFFNRLNITATQPASPAWLSIKYHNQPTVPSGGFWGMAQAIAFYFVLAGTFFFVGGFLCQQILSLWFTDMYLNAANWKLFFGCLLFWNTMYLLRYGLFLLFTGLASLLATFPLRAGFGLLALGYLLLLPGELKTNLTAHTALTCCVAVMAIALILFEKEILHWFRRFSATPLNEPLARPPGLGLRPSSGAFSGESIAAEGCRSPRRWRAESEFGDPKAQSTGPEHDGPPGSPPCLARPAEVALQEKLDHIKADPCATLGVVYMGGDDLSFQKLTPALLLGRWRILRDGLDSQGLRLLFGLAGRPDDTTLEGWFRQLYETEKRCDVTLWHPLQVIVPGETPWLDPELGLNLAVDSHGQREQLLTAWHIRRWLVTMMSTAGHAQDTGVTLVDIALRLAREGLGANTVFYLLQNKYDNNDHNRPVQTPYDQGELGQRNKLARLLSAVAPGSRAYSVQNWTPFGFKAGGLTGMDLVHEESLKLTTMLLLDRNATVHDLDALMEDLAVALTDPNLIIIIPGRGTTNTLTAIGQGSQMVEEGHRSFLKGLMALLGGTASESVGTGWGNLLAVFYGRVQRAMVDSATPKMPLTSRMRRGSSFAVRVEGLIGFAPHAVGISEDTWAVSQAAHNAVAFGRRVTFRLSRAFWHKIRETWSHAEWLASFPRWSGGFVQMMHDPIMQQINDFGPASVFAKEIRANSGRNFLSAPFALLNILLMPLAIMLDVTPFVQILIVLWNFGFIMNQILTVHGLNACLESSGFYRIPALLGGALAALGSLWVPVLRPFAPGLIVLGVLYGGFLVGLNRWLYTRVRDVILFGPQLVLHTLGQIVRQTMEFTLSGASPEDAKGVNMSFRAWVGPREDQPLNRFPNFINLKTVVWVVGLLSVVLNLFALSNLDMLNVLLLLPSLLFSVSAVVGPFILRPKVGPAIGQRALLSKAAGWLAGLSFYTLVSALIARGGGPLWLGLTLLVIVIGLVARQGLRYSTYRWRLERLTKRLVDLLAGAGLANPEAARLAGKICQQTGGDPAKVHAALTEAGVASEHHAGVVQFVRERIAVWLRGPVQDLQEGWSARRRFLSEFNRSLVLSLFVLVWFFIVPVPGLFVFRAGEYRLSVELGTILWSVCAVIGAVLAGAWVGQFVQWLDRRGSWGPGLVRRVEQAYGSLQSLRAAPGRLTDQEISSLYALFTDLKTYLDQRSYAYAGRSLNLIEETLRTVRAR